jgi:hypothetical protein
MTEDLLYYNVESIVVIIVVVDFKITYNYTNCKKLTKINFYVLNN